MTIVLVITQKRDLMMKLSTRNQLQGIITAIHSGPVNAEVTIDVDGVPVIAVVTQTSVERLGLTLGSPAYALIKASWIVLTTAAPNLKLSTRNQWCGTIQQLTHGAVATEVTLTIQNQFQLTAVITHTSALHLDLAIGQSLCACVKASHIIVAVD
jgi:molybdate transport system regulatory protein